MTPSEYYGKAAEHQTLRIPTERTLRINIENWCVIRDAAPSGWKWAYANGKVMLLRHRLRELGVEEG